MQSSEIREPFAKEANRAGWIAVIASTSLAVACYWLAKVMKSPVIFVLYPPGLGAAAVGTLNFRRWWGFGESMAACFLAVVNVCKVVGILTLLCLVFSIAFGPVFLYYLVLIICAAIYWIGYVVLGFAIVVLAACLGGSVLYGLLWVMRYVGQTGRADADTKGRAPHPLRMVV